MEFHVDDITLRRYLDGDLPFEETEQLERYIRSSPQCARRLLELGRMQLEKPAPGAPAPGEEPEYGLPREFGHYEVNYLIAVGGKGFVYQGIDRNTDEQIALKILRPEAVEENHSVIRFRREAELMQTLRHPNIVRVNEAGRLLGHFYIAMEFVSGPNLHQFVRHRERVNMRTTLTIASQVARALIEAHSRGIIHRDVKPSNVLIETTGIVKVGDFGLARLVDDETSHISKARRLIGSPVCIPPEQIRGQQADFRADVYGVGCLLFFMATGQFPFGGDRMEMIRGHLFTPAPAPSELAPDVPDWFDHLVARCLEKDPNDRWADMEKLFNVLLNLRAKA